MPNLIFTLLDHEGNYKPAQYSIPSIQKYAKKINADFEIVYGDKDSSVGDLMYHKFKIYDYLSVYDRVLFVDADILIQNHAINIFEYVPEDSLAMYDESNTMDAVYLFQLWVAQYNVLLREYKLPIVQLNKWNGKYYNAGLFLASQIHKDIFKEIIPDRVDFMAFEQNVINTNIIKNNTKMFDLPYNFNAMHSYPGKYRYVYDLNKNVRKNAYFIHGGDIGEFVSFNSTK